MSPGHPQSWPPVLVTVWLPPKLSRQISMNSWNPELGYHSKEFVRHGHGLLVMMWHGVSGGRMLSGRFSSDLPPRKLLVKSSIFWPKSEGINLNFLGSSSNNTWILKIFLIFSIFPSDWDCTNGIQIITMKNPPRFKGEDFWVIFFSHPHPFQSPIQGVFSQLPPQKNNNGCHPNAPKTMILSRGNESSSNHLDFQKIYVILLLEEGKQLSPGTYIRSWPVKFRH